nr:hypothetical protein [Tanacetum cinerariifolium]
MSDPASLRSMSSQAKIVLNCVGPFFLYGNPFVAASCAFDSVPAELELMFSNRQFGVSGVPNQIEAYLSLESYKMMLNYGSLESAVLWTANADKLAEFRRARKKVGLWGVTFPSPDASVVQRTHLILADKLSGLQRVNEDPKQAEERAAFCWGGFGRWLLLTFPSFFNFGGSKKGSPTEEQADSESFKMWLVGQGFTDANLASQGNAKPDTEISTRVMGPEIGYLTTLIILVQCALILLNQRQDLRKGGIFHPGIVFGPTDLQD